MTEPATPTVRTRDFYSIAHRAGNNLHHLEQALIHGVDAIECDFWHARGKLALRHERKLPALPVLYDKWFIRWAWGTLSLPNLLREVNFRAELFLDIKSSTPRAADAVLELYNNNESMMPPTRVSSRQWKLLDRIGRAGTKLRTYYSIGRTGEIDALLRRPDDGAPATGTSIRHTLLSKDVVSRFHDHGLQVFAWTVNTRHRAEELLDWGVDGIISDDIGVFDFDAELRGSATSE